MDNIVQWLFDLEPRTMNGLSLIGLALASYSFMFIPNVPNQKIFLVITILFSILAFMQIILGVSEIIAKTKVQKPKESDNNPELS